MPVNLPFDDEWNYGDTHTVSLPVRLQNLNYFVEATIDTGAAVSYFDSALLPDLGISDVTTGTQIALTAANGERSTGHLHALQIEILGHRLIVSAAFCPDWPQGTKNLLGMRDFFEQIRIAFEHRDRKFYYTIPTPSAATASGPPS